MVEQATEDKAILEERKRQFAQEVSLPAQQFDEAIRQFEHQRYTPLSSNQYIAAARRLLNAILWAAGINSRAKLVSAIFTVSVSMILRNELVILVARAGLDEAVTRGIVYGLGWVTYVLGAHFNAYVFGKKEWR